MAADLPALLALQKRRTQRAQDAFAVAERARQQAEQAVMAAARQFQVLEDTHQQRRTDRVKGVLATPPSAVSLAQIRLQYEIGEEELREAARRILALRAEQQAAEEVVKRAHEALQAATRRERKLEEAVSRVKLGERRLDDVRAEMELER